MDEAILQQIFDELFSSLEPLETQNAALLQFLKAKSIATDEELAPYLEQAGNASNVRWRGVRVRAGALISSALKPPEQAPALKSAELAPEPSAGATGETSEKKATSEKEGDQKNATPEKDARQQNGPPHKKAQAQPRACSPTLFPSREGWGIPSRDGWTPNVPGSLG